MTDFLDKAGRWVGEAAAKARERERLRIEDRLRLLDGIDELARRVVHIRRHKPGYGWEVDLDDVRLRLLGMAPTIDDPELDTRIAELDESQAAGDKGPRDALDSAYLSVARRLAELRRETFTERGD